MAFNFEFSGQKMSEINVQTSYKLYNSKIHVLKWNTKVEKALSLSLRVRDIQTTTEAGSWQQLSEISHASQNKSVMHNRQQCARPCHSSIPHDDKLALIILNNHYKYELSHTEVCDVKVCSLLIAFHHN